MDQRLKAFRKKYYTDKIIRGSLILALLITSMLFVVLLSEGIFGFSSAVRTAIVFGLGLVFLGVLVYMVLWPLSQLFNWAKTISDFQIAEMVRTHFPEINDKLTNLLQLKRSAVGSSALASAAIDKKARDIAPVPLSSAINLNLNTRYLKYLAVPVLLFLITYFTNPSLISTSGHRLVHYNQQFAPPAPFKIQIDNLPQQIVAGQDYELNVNIVEQKELPNELYIYIKKASENQFIDYNLTKKSPTAFTYTLSDIKEDFELYVGNPEVRTEVFAVDVLKRPFIRKFQVSITYPAYTGLGVEKLEENVGDFKVVKGSLVKWQLEPNGDLAQAYLVAGDSLPFVMDEAGGYSLSRRMMRDMDYFISLNSTEGISNVDTVKYRVNIIQDRYPSVYVFSPNNDFLIDLDPNMPLELEIADDYGFTKMALYYRFIKSGGISQVTQTHSEYPLGIEKNVLLQPLAYNVDLTSLGLQEGDELEYYIKVWDNDGVAGPKASTSAVYKGVYPTLDAKYDEVSEKQDAFKEDIEAMNEKAKELQESYRKMQEKLLDKKRLSFDDKKEIQELIDQHQQLTQELEEAQQKFEETKDELQQNQMISEQTLEKYEELNEFLEELDNPEIEKLLEELQEKLENFNSEDLMDKLEELQMNDEDLQKSLERTLELLKQLEVNQKSDEIRNKLDNLKAKEDVLNEQLENAETSEELEQNAQRQEELSKQMEGIKEDLKELEEMKSKTQTPDEEAMKELMEQAEEIQQDMQEASEQSQEAAEQKNEKGRKNQQQSQQSQQNASQKQQKASEQLQQMSEQMESMQMDMQMQQDQQNLESLRELLENLLKLSFDQEDLRDEVKELKYGDPALKDKSQEQKKLQDDMNLVRDSLESLANKVPEIQKMVLDESKNITENMGKSQTYFRNKQVPMITMHQQAAMTSINNLANMLSDVMKQIQQNMMNMQQGQGMCTKPGGQKPNMQQLSKQQQQLNQQLQQMLQQGNMDPKKLQEMAAQQEAIRKQLKEAHERIKQEGGKALGDMDKITQDMIQSETELINRQLTHETLMRQQQILSRLLQADKSVRERELDDKRESKTAKELERKAPEDLTLEEYKNKIRQELLKSNKLEYSNDFIILIEQYYKKLESTNDKK
ncbi:MAG: hypothetical protein D6730_08140 [Bacteroidetes bacterium]|nr:MAG: hypothetical protein D6730_08140 [Bacteroidota bacterium]